MKNAENVENNGDAEIKRQLEKIFDDMMSKTKIVFVPDENDPFNLDKTMVWVITENEN